ncbi:conserved oligomeric Golgi complex subunit 2 [Salmo salar]|uniref:Conserved oligomeric Golgi complex subunit 2 n=1 Tax=Salmo salar TaxID=8030 RepID=B5DG14_SALSA|nr:conserved oligomeric Golgi complex subunit 2 [Salmo salar]XP_029620995.1 conserved oligomeric Golgi complex subunit 2-like isoform X1 [Salmo trutta]ACH70688.1 component of oligomeric golgi complex 2 [Salmo salar]|eukprot:NP_001133098.1 conserved oligomeric Golgi complex subunit 2 [Salmo salar]
MNLPKGPDSLCFDKDVFMKDDFDVDQFVADCRKHVQLEEMREDLEMYYKLLKTAMVELINKDYADFVNLSTNLVGMDKALNQLSVPLGQLQEEVLSLRTSVSEVIQAIDNQLSKQDDLQNKKMCVTRLIQVVRSVEKIEKILHSQNSKDSTSLEISSPLLAGQILERIATEFNQLQFHAVQSKGMPLLDKVRPRISGITSMLQQSLEGLLIQGLQTSNVDIVRHCLRTYATIDKTRDAEALVGQVLVKPYMDEVIVEQLVKSTPNGLQIMYTKLLEFVPHHCRLLREVTGMAISSEKADIVPGYDFLVNSVWPEIIKGIDERIPSLFNAGNPDTFYERYTISMDFVRKFDRQCGSQASVRRLRAHASYQSFHNKWNLPVYFQLRYKEIAACLENAIADGLEAAPAGSCYHLLVSQVLWNSLVRCWAEKVYLPPLSHRFWKLTLQLISRYSKFLTEMLTKSPSTEVSKDPVRPLPSSASSTSSRTSQDDGGSESGSPATLSTKQLVFIASDVDKLQDQIPELSKMIMQKLEVIGYKNVVIVGEALEDSKASLSGCIPTLNSKMTQHLTERCFRFLKSASEVPRLYRRTNKEVPFRASAYMDNALRPLHQLLSDSKDMVKPSIAQDWLRITLNDCTHRYFETISEVLSSVKKMEESLKRLKQARKTATTNTIGTTGGPTDDSKIRLQLALDVEYLGEQIQKMGLQPADITMFSTLNDLVQGAQDVTPSEQAGP